MNLISRKSFCDELGVPETTVKSWQKNNYWKRGVHYVVVGKTTLVKKDEAEKWLSEGFRQDSVNKTLVSASASRSTESPTQKNTKAPVTKLTSPLA